MVRSVIPSRCADPSTESSGPGQHIRPAPPVGPGSTSASGLVDYANVFVKVSSLPPLSCYSTKADLQNLDPDINSYYLTEMFRNVSLPVLQSKALS